MPIEEEVKQKKNDKKLSFFNSTNYSYSQDLGLVHSRQYYSVKSTKKSYNINTPPVDVEVRVSKSDFISGRESYLHFTLDTNHNNLPGASYGVGSAVNWISRIQLITKDGQMLDDINGVNKITAVTDRWTKGADYMLNQGEMSGYDSIGGNVGGTYVVPLGDIIPLFKYQKLLSPNLMDGLTLRFYMAPAYDIILDETAPALVDWTVEISDVKVVFDTYTMDKLIVDSVNSGRIDMEFVSHKHQNKEYNTKNHVLPLNYTVSKSLKAVAITNTVDTQLGDNHLKALFAQDSNRSNTYDLAKYRWRVGNRMNPSQPILNSLECFVNSLRVFDKFGRNDSEVGISFDEYKSKYNNMCLDLRRSPNMLNVGGTPIDNGNLLELHHTHSTGGDRVVDLWVFFLKRITIMPVSPEDEQKGLWDKISITE